MISGKTISIKSLIAKVYRDLQLKEEEDFMSMIEWAAEALDHIHVYPQYTHQLICIPITSYKTELPCDFIDVESLEYNGQNLLETNNPFGPQTTIGNTGIYYTPYSYNQSKIENAVFVNPNDLSYNRGNSSIKIENGWLKTSFNTGNVNMIYTAQPMDDEGYPMLPDEVSFREALYRYIVYKYLYAKYLHGEITENVYQDAKNEWKYYCNQAGAQALMPNGTQLENLKRSFVSLKPRTDLFNSFYNSL